MAQETLRFDLSDASHTALWAQATAVANAYFGAQGHSLEIEFGAVRVDGEPVGQDKPYHATFVAVGTFA